MDNVITLQKRKHNEYRLTRDMPYMNSKCIGFDDLSARQGYYIVAASAVEAKRIMSKTFPGEDSFTCELWKEDVDG